MGLRIRLLVSFDISIAQSALSVFNHQAIFFFQVNTIQEKLIAVDILKKFPLLKKRQTEIRLKPAKVTEYLPTELILTEQNGWHR